MIYIYMIIQNDLHIIYICIHNIGASLNLEMM
jgi:hypothetical protein